MNEERNNVAVQQIPHQSQANVSLPVEQMDCPVNCVQTSALWQASRLETEHIRITCFKT